MKKITLATVSLGLAFSVANAQAAGYQLNEYSASGIARSFAGAGIMGDDYSSLAYNPAGMTLVKRSGLQLGFTEAEMSSHVKDNSPARQKTRMHYGVALPSGFGQWNVNDKLFLGAGVYVPFGLSTHHKKDSFVGNHARKSMLEVVDTNLSVAYRVNDKLSLGASGILRYIYGDMTAGNGAIGKHPFNSFEVEDWTATWAIGAMYEFSKDTRFGISYKAKSKQTATGDHMLKANNMVYVFDAESSPDLPSTVILSAYHRPFEKIGLSATARWTEWSIFDEFVLESDMVNPYLPGGGKTKVSSYYNWRDTWTISLGLDYYLNSNWTLRVGGAYDQSPAKDAYSRTNRIPDGNRMWVSGGFSYMKDNWQIDVGAAHLYIKKADIADFNGEVPAEYSSHSNMYGIDFQYKF